VYHVLNGGAGNKEISSKTVVFDTANIGKKWLEVRG